MSQQGMRGPDKKKRKKRNDYEHTVKMEIRVPQEVANWLRQDDKPSHCVTEIIHQKIKEDKL